MKYLWSVISLNQEKYRYGHLESPRKVKKITFQTPHVKRKKTDSLRRKHKQTVEQDLQEKKIRDIGRTLQSNGTK